MNGLPRGGFNLPPGCTTSDIERAQGDDMTDNATIALNEAADSVDLFGNAHNRKMPISREQLTAALLPRLRSIELADLVRLMVNEIEEIFEYSQLSNGSNTCQKTSLLFNPHRLSTGTTVSESIMEAMQKESFISGLARVILGPRKSCSLNTMLYQAIGLGANGIQYVNEFPPYIARNLCQDMNLQANARVLDPCAGWGGRMLGVSVVTDNYFAYEPSSQTHAGLLQLAKWIQNINPSFNATVYRLPFEESRLVDDSYDFALTSPPYYDTEHYSDEETNSCNRYATFDAWCYGFYVPLIGKTLAALKPGCTFALNIGSRKYPLNEVMQANFGSYCKITKYTGPGFSGQGGLGKAGEGETIYLLQKPGRLI